jgi:nucleoside-diphosphate-sugar epimerase
MTIAGDTPNEYEGAYLDTAYAFRRIAISGVPPRRLIYTSSTSLYGDHRGMWVDETSKLKIKSDHGQTLIETERVLLSLADQGWRVCILRCAEIYGPSRELSQRIRSLQGQTLPGSGKNFSNMIHRMDVVSAVDFAMRHRLGGIYNLSDDDHPTRQDLYDKIAGKLGVPSVSWDPNASGWHGGNKRISNRKIKAKGFSFRYPHRILDYTEND